tara:strand:- start:14938 stop:15771 length:834 start_codon:yes stop_codon:yes gene_type:complete
MRLLTKTTDYDETIKLANKLTGEYDKSVIFHCYWHGNLNEKHLYSVLSCYYFNVLNRKHKIILWLENNTPNDINKEISKYCEIKQFSLQTEKEKSEILVDYNYKFGGITFYSDFARVLLLYNYGGCWFDLDCFILRSFDPIFKNYKKEVCVYQWEKQNYPNNAIFISLEPKSIKMKQNINFIINRNRGWGFHQARLTYDLPLEMLVLPCSWFDGGWIENPYHNRPVGSIFFKNTEKEYTFDNFFYGAFCYHWHNQWKKPIEDNSIVKQLVQIIKKRL